MAERILLTTSNGTGLGHLTRSMAIARRLPEGIEPLFVTLSAAAPVVRELGFPVEYVASYGTPGSGNDYRWSRRLRGRLRAAIDEIEPAVIVFDGTHPYEAVLGAFAHRSKGRAVWCRRPLWKHGADRTPLARARAFDAVLEPGELAESEDRGPTVALRGQGHRVGPIVLLDRSELLPRAEAERALGLEPGRTNVLVTLGQGDEVREATTRCLRHLAARDDVQVAALSSAITHADDSTGAFYVPETNKAPSAPDGALLPDSGRKAPIPPGVVHLDATYPMSRHFAAFDAAVSAAGYNAFHELIALGVPALYVPMHRETDDQPARARWADQAGLGLGVDDASDPRLEAKLDQLIDDHTPIAARLADLEPATGAQEAALWLTDLAEHRRGRDVRPPRRPVGVDGPASTDTAGTGRGGRMSRPRPGRRGGRMSRPRPGRLHDFRRRWTQFIRYAPRTVVRLTRQQLTQPRPRTLVFAVGIDDDLVKAVREALADTPDPPERVLVVTDSLELAALRELGVGIEHIPARGERQPELAGGDYETFLRRRLDLILAERPRARRVLTAHGGIAPPSGTG